MTALEIDRGGRGVGQDEGALVTVLADGEASLAREPFRHPRPNTSQAHQTSLEPRAIVNANRDRIAARPQPRASVTPCHRARSRSCWR